MHTETHTNVYFVLLLLETRSSYMAWVGVELKKSTQFPECQDWSHVPACLAHIFKLHFMLNTHLGFEKMVLNHYFPNP